MFTTKAKQETCKRDIEPKTVCNDDQSGKKLQRQEVSTPETLDTDGKPTRRNNIPLLTGSVQVGMLYDAKSDQPLYGDYLWPPAKNPNDPNKPQIIEANVSHSSMDYIFDESILDRLSLIDVDAELKLSFMTGMIQVIIFFDSEYVTFLLKMYLIFKISGSAAYLHEEKRYSHSVRQIMKYHTTSRQKQLVADDATKDKNMCKHNAQKIKDLGATHVISEVTYGFNAYLMFEKEIEKHETKKQIEGSLEVVVKAIPSFQVEGKAQINLNETENSTMAKLAFTFHGDTQLGKVNLIENYRRLNY